MIGVKLQAEERKVEGTNGEPHHLIGQVEGLTAFGKHAETFIEPSHGEFDRARLTSHHTLVKERLREATVFTPHRTITEDQSLASNLCHELRAPE